METAKDGKESTANKVDDAVDQREVSFECRQASRVQEAPLCGAFI